ncbi:MAG TPA: hypothetical protein ENG05_03050 [Acidilobales archaeon]|nr:hypothetical protein [Acidilobales archaeon]
MSLIKVRFRDECKEVREVNELAYCIHGEELRFVLMTSIPRDAVDILTLILSLGIAHSVEDFVDEFIGLRWPSKVIVGRDVIALTNFKTLGRDVEDRVKVLINTSITLSKLRRLRDYGELIASIVSRFTNYVSEALRDVMEGVRSKYVIEYMSKFSMLGEEIRVELTNGSSVEGEVLGLRRDGSLIVLSKEGMKYISPSMVKNIEVLWP